MASMDSFIVVYESFIVLLQMVINCPTSLTFVLHAIPSSCNTSSQFPAKLSCMFGDSVSTGDRLLAAYTVWDDVILMGLGEEIASHFCMLCVTRKLIKWHWAGPLQMNVNIGQGSNFVVHNDS